MILFGFGFVSNCCAFRGGLVHQAREFTLMGTHLRAGNTTEARISGVFLKDLISGYWEREALTPLASGES